MAKDQLLEQVEALKNQPVHVRGSQFSSSTLREIPPIPADLDTPRRKKKHALRLSDVSP